MNKVISKDGAAIAFERMGSGPPLILVDGALYSRAFGPTPKLAPLLSRGTSGHDNGSVRGVEGDRDVLLGDDDREPNSLDRPGRFAPATSYQQKSALP